VEHSALADVGGSLLKFLRRSKMKMKQCLMGEVVAAFLVEGMKQCWKGLVWG
jgi:hypothetical protein